MYQNYFFFPVFSAWARENRRGTHTFPYGAISRRGRRWMMYGPRPARNDLAGKGGTTQNAGSAALRDSRACGKTIDGKDCLKVNLSFWCFPCCPSGPLVVLKDFFRFAVALLRLRRPLCQFSGGDQ